MEQYIIVCPTKSHVQNKNIQDLLFSNWRGRWRARNKNAPRSSILKRECSKYKIWLQKYYVACSYCRHNNGNTNLRTTDLDPSKVSIHQSFYKSILSYTISLFFFSFLFFFMGIGPQTHGVLNIIPCLTN